MKAPFTKAPVFALFLPATALSVGAAITVAAVYAVAAIVGLGLLLLFVLAFRREIVVHIEWSKKEKRIWFERIPRRAR